MVYHDLAVDGLAHLDIILIVVVNGKGIYLLIGQTCTPHSLDFRQDVGNTLIYALVLLAKTLGKGIFAINPNPLSPLFSSLGVLIYMHPILWREIIK